MHWGAIALNSVAMYHAWGTCWCVPLFALQGLLINYLYPVADGSIVLKTEQEDLDPDSPARKDL